MVADACIETKDMPYKAVHIHDMRQYHSSLFNPLQVQVVCHLMLLEAEWTEWIKEGPELKVCVPCNRVGPLDGPECGIGFSGWLGFDERA